MKNSAGHNASDQIPQSIPSLCTGGGYLFDFSIIPERQFPPGCIGQQFGREGFGKPVFSGKQQFLEFLFILKPFARNKVPDPSTGGLRAERDW